MNTLTVVIFKVSFHYMPVKLDTVFSVSFMSFDLET